MLKKFESLGTVLSRDEAKKIIGGEDEGLNFTLVCNDCSVFHIATCYEAPIICECHGGEFSCD